eukprot:Tbor_TRINITY_DN3328_c0_g1::TRINITY_DN3328_c0_g1_i1::g.23521::m.23521
MGDSPLAFTNRPHSNVSSIADSSIVNTPGKSIDMTENKSFGPISGEMFRKIDLLIQQDEILFISERRKVSQIAIQEQNENESLYQEKEEEYRQILESLKDAKEERKSQYVYERSQPKNHLTNMSDRPSYVRLPELRDALNELQELDAEEEKNRRRKDRIQMEKNLKRENKQKSPTTPLINVIEPSGIDSIDSIAHAHRSHKNRVNSNLCVSQVDGYENNDNELIASKRKSTCLFSAEKGDPYNDVNYARREKLQFGEGFDGSQSNVPTTARWQPMDSKLHPECSAETEAHKLFKHNVNTPISNTSQYSTNRETEMVISDPVDKQECVLHTSQEGSHCVIGSEEEKTDDTKTDLINDIIDLNLNHDYFLNFRQDTLVDGYCGDMSLDEMLRWTAATDLKSWLLKCTLGDKVTYGSISKLPNVGSAIKEAINANVSGQEGKGQIKEIDRETPLHHPLYDLVTWLDAELASFGYPRSINITEAGNNDITERYMSLPVKLPIEKKSLDANLQNIYGEQDGMSKETSYLRAKHDISRLVDYQKEEDLKIHIEESSEFGHVNIKGRPMMDSVISGSSDEKGKQKYGNNVRASEVTLAGALEEKRRDKKRRSSKHNSLPRHRRVRELQFMVALNRAILGNTYSYERTQCDQMNDVFEHKETECQQ